MYSERASERAKQEEDVELGLPDTELEYQPHGEVHLSPQSIWPISLAAGITLAGAGAVTNWFISFIGVFVMLFSIVYWVQELRHERHELH